MHFKTEQRGSITIVTLAGKIEPKNEEDLYAFLSTLLHSGKKSLLINMHEVSFLSTGGVRAFLRIHNDCQALKGKIILSCLSSSIVELFEKAHLDKELQYYDSLYEAEANFN